MFNKSETATDKLYYVGQKLGFMLGMCRNVTLNKVGMTGMKVIQSNNVKVVHVINAGDNHNSINFSVTVI